MDHTTWWRCLSASITLALLTTTGGRLQADMYGISAPGHGALSVVNGKVYSTTTGDMDWHITKTAKGYTFRVAGGKWDGWYLTYDPDGKKKPVFLSKEPIAGSYWKSGGPPDRPGTSWIAGQSGKVEDWHIDRGEEAEKLKGPPMGKLPAQGEKKEKPKEVKEAEQGLYTAYTVILAEKPKHVRKVRITVIAP
jgi:hypothetical protein